MERSFNPLCRVIGLSMDEVDEALETWLVLIPCVGSLGCRFTGRMQTATEESVLIPCVGSLGCRFPMISEKENIMKSFNPLCRVIGLSMSWSIKVSNRMKSFNPLCRVIGLSMFENTGLKLAAQGT